MSHSNFCLRRTPRLFFRTSQHNEHLARTYVQQHNSNSSLHHRFSHGFLCFSCGFAAYCEAQPCPLCGIRRLDNPFLPTEYNLRYHKTTLSKAIQLRRQSYKKLLFLAACSMSLYNTSIESFSQKTCLSSRFLSEFAKMPMVYDTVLLTTVTLVKISIALLIARVLQ